MSDKQYVITGDGIYPAALIVITKATEKRFYGYEDPEMVRQSRRLSWRYNKLQGHRPNQYVDRNDVLIGPEEATPELFRALIEASEPLLNEKHDQKVAH